MPMLVICNHLPREVDACFQLRIWWLLRYEVYCHTLKVM